MSVRMRVAVGALVGVVLLAIVVAVVPQLGRRDVARNDSPVASGTPSESAVESPSAEATATALTPDDTAAIFAEIEEQVIEVRGLPAAEIGPPDILTREELRAQLEADFGEEYPEEEQAEDNVTLRAMGLLEPNQDVAELQLELLGEGVAGRYYEDEKRMVVVTDEGITGEAKITYAHEYTHALQDAAFGLDALDIDAEGDDDGAMARLALAEGDATLTMSLWARDHLTPEELFEGSQSEPPDISDIPQFLVESLLFSYNAGGEFVNRLYLEGGFDAVDRAYTELPQSTEQIIHAEKYLDGEPPVEIELPDLAAGLGAGWEQVESTPIGEGSLAITLRDLDVRAVDANAAAEGWGGDQLAVAAGPSEAFALAWKLAWDSAADADEFVAVYEEVAADLPFPATARALPDGTVLVAHASSQDVLESVLAVVE